MTVRPLPPAHLLKDSDLTREQINQLLESATLMKQERKTGTERRRLAEKNIALLFEKPSTRTRSAFEVAAYEQGGHCTYIDSNSSHVGITESIADTATVLGRFYDGIAFRGFEQATVETLAAHAGVPVWNALTDRWHPTQALADLLTMKEASARSLQRSRCAFLATVTTMSLTAS